MITAFFDIDGVLSVPRYIKDDNFTIGGSDKWWKKYNSQTDNTYKYCIAPEKIKKFLNFFKSKGVNLKVLSTESDINAKYSKRQFIKEHYSEYFSYDDIIFVNYDDGKLEYLEDYSNKNNISYSDIYFLEDTFSTAIKAAERGINAHHISEFLVSDFGLNENYEDQEWNIASKEKEYEK